MVVNWTSDNLKKKVDMKLVDTRRLLKSLREVYELDMKIKHLNCLKGIIYGTQLNLIATCEPGCCDLRRCIPFQTLKGRLSRWKKVRRGIQSSTAKVLKLLWQLYVINEGHIAFQTFS